ncbi:hypothetical protein THIOM_002979 [Candidatus Thiomargarita nelsonii]|uniref:Uncharacterized protein n=1 Tax=Candidatus Thiomargarita nelsonii TaxID=1003181 RepID=A0A0A6RIR5_9GAMM|nr:hypothetical protein THIOM_002979 [Candidatus Thiomargarita nelsonii]
MTTIASGKKTTGMVKLLHSLNNKLQHMETQVRDKIDCVLTIDGHVSYEDGLGTLTSFQSVLYRLLVEEENNQAIFSSDYIDDVQRYQNFLFGIKAYGRIILETLSDPIENRKDEWGKNDVLFGYIGIPRMIYDKSLYKTEQIVKQQRERQEFACAYLRDMTSQKLNEIIEYIEHIHRCMAPVTYYVDEFTYSNFYNVGKNSGKYDYCLMETLARLKKTDFQSWIKQEVELIFSLYFLLQSGPQIRGEEFNNQQINPVILERFFDKKWAYYLKKQHNLDSKTLNDKYQTSRLPEKAEFIKFIRAQLEKEYRFYRSINGINLKKRELMFLKSELALGLDYFPKDIGKYLVKQYGIKVQSFSDVYDLFRHIVDISLDEKWHEKKGFEIWNNPLEELIHVIISSSIKCTNSDFGMTRNLRRLSHMIWAHKSNAIEEACSWPQTDYFCYVIPDEKICMSIEKDKLLSILRAISARMQFNSWHYLPGNFTISEVPSKRDYYFPPKMADIAEWSDQHHPGHIYTSVRYSIRSPAQVTIDGKDYFAFFDLRLMRTPGKPPYTMREFRVALAYTRYLQMLYQAIVNRLLETQEEFEFTFGSKKWYNKHCVCSIVFNN